MKLYKLSEYLSACYFLSTISEKKYNKFHTFKKNQKSILKYIIFPLMPPPHPPFFKALKVKTD